MVADTGFVLRIPVCDDQSQNTVDYTVVITESNHRPSDSGYPRMTLTWYVSPLIKGQYPARRGLIYAPTMPVGGPVGPHRKH